MPDVPTEESRDEHLYEADPGEGPDGKRGEEAHLKELAFHMSISSSLILLGIAGILGLLSGWTIYPLVVLAIILAWVYPKLGEQEGRK